MVLLFFVFFFVVSAITVVNAKRETVFFGKNWYDILYNKCIYIENMMMMIVTGKNMLHRIFVSDYCYY